MESFEKPRFVVKVDGVAVKASEVEVVYEGVDVPGEDACGQVVLKFTDEGVVGDLWVPDADSDEGETTNAATFWQDPYMDLAKLVMRLDQEADE